MRRPRSFVLSSIVVLACGAVCALAARPSHGEDVKAPPAPGGSSMTGEQWHALWDYGDPVASEKRFREALAKAQAASDGSARALVVILRTQVARAQGLQGKFDDAHATLDVAEKDARPEEKGLWGWIAIERGRAFNSSKKPDLAKRSFEKALAFAELAGDEDLAIDCVHMLAIVAKGDEALRLNEKAIAMAEVAKAPRARGWLGALYNNTGWTYFEKHEYEKALALQKKNWDWHAERKAVDGARIGKWSYARVLRALGRLDEAMKLQEELRAEFEGDGKPDGFVYEELGELLLAKGKPADAKPWFAKAYALLSKEAEVRDDPKRLERLKALGEGREPPKEPTAGK